MSFTDFLPKINDNLNEVQSDMEVGLKKIANVKDLLHKKIGNDIKGELDYESTVENDTVADIKERVNYIGNKIQLHLVEVCWKSEGHNVILFLIISIMLTILVSLIHRYKKKCRKQDIRKIENIKCRAEEDKDLTAHISRQNDVAIDNPFNLKQNNVAICNLPNPTQNDDVAIYNLSNLTQNDVEIYNPSDRKQNDDAINDPSNSTPDDIAVKDPSSQKQNKVAVYDPSNSNKNDVLSNNPSNFKQNDNFEFCDAGPACSKKENMLPVPSALIQSEPTLPNSEVVSTPVKTEKGKEKDWSKNRDNTFDRITRSFCYRFNDKQ